MNYTIPFHLSFVEGYTRSRNNTINKMDTSEVRIKLNFQANRRMSHSYLHLLLKETNLLEDIKHTFKEMLSNLPEDEWIIPISEIKDDSDLFNRYDKRPVHGECRVFAEGKTIYALLYVKQPLNTKEDIFELIQGLSLKKKNIKVGS
ncbi:hypothetical protein ACFYKX_11415 [Cytobacillus sp. FJAT-54145]|uniref:Uncharacterized protein n=1 Tax=Cytobacillus spartinae TaxID=3299023 RepID=A0ABW6KAF8_9BACI